MLNFFALHMSEGPELELGLLHLPQKQSLSVQRPLSGALPPWHLELIARAFVLGLLVFLKFCYATKGSRHGLSFLVSGIFIFNAIISI